MNKKDKVKFVIKSLEKLYPKVSAPLDHKDPYTFLIAVLLSAQSTDAGVNKVTPILFKKADNPYDMIKLSVEEIRNIIKPVGLSPMKSKGIYGLSKILISKYGGMFQKTLMRLNRYLRLDIKQQVLLCLKFLMFLLFRLILIYTA